LEFSRLEKFFRKKLRKKLKVEFWRAQNKNHAEICKPRYKKVLFPRVDKTREFQDENSTK